MDGYAPARIVALPALAARLGLESIHVKDETDRYGLPAFKVLGAAWAVARLLSQRLGSGPCTAGSLEELRTLLQGRSMTLTAATQGNHGRAVSRVARWLGIGAHIFVPAGTAPGRIAAIEGEGAVVEVSASYDAAVQAAHRRGAEGQVVVSDASWDPGAPVPQWIIEGYSTIFWELEDGLGGPLAPNLFLVQIGVGALASAVVRYVRARAPEGSVILGVEPADAACALAAVRAGRIVSLPRLPGSAMSCLNCQTASLASWPELRDGLDYLIAISDDDAALAVGELARAGVWASESGAAGLAGLMVAARERPAGFELPARPRAIALVTERSQDA